MNGSKVDCFPPGEPVRHGIHCVNENGPECLVKLVVTCKGTYVSLDSDGNHRWESEEEEIAGRQTPGQRSHDFDLSLILTNTCTREVKEKLVIEVFMKRRAGKELKREGAFQHSIRIQPALNNV